MLVCKIFCRLVVIPRDCPSGVSLRGIAFHLRWAGVVVRGRRGGFAFDRSWTTNADERRGSCGGFALVRYRWRSDDDERRGGGGAAALVCSRRTSSACQRRRGGGFALDCSRRTSGVDERRGGVYDDRVDGGGGYGRSGGGFTPVRSKQMNGAGERWGGGSGEGGGGFDLIHSRRTRVPMSTLVAAASSLSATNTRAVPTGAGVAAAVTSPSSAPNV